MAPLKRLKFVMGAPKNVSPFLRPLLAHGRFPLLLLHVPYMLERWSGSRWPSVYDEPAGVGWPGRPDVMGIVRMTLSPFFAIARPPFPPATCSTTMCVPFGLDGALPLPLSLPFVSRCSECGATPCACCSVCASSCARSFLPS